MKKEWFEDWFSSKEYLDVYNHRDIKDAEKIIDLILANIKLNKNSKILDVACGNGRHSILLAEKGFNVTAFDLSKTLLNIGKKKAEQLNLNINFINADIRKFYINTQFDLVINLFTSFGYFDSDEENFRFIKNAFSMLNENGKYVLDFLNKNFVKKNLIPHSEKIVNDKIIVEDRKIWDNRVIKKIQIISGGEKAEFMESVKLYSDDEIIHNLQKIGFKVDKLFGDYNGESFNKNSSGRFIAIFKK